MKEEALNAGFNFWIVIKGINTFLAGVFQPTRFSDAIQQCFLMGGILPMERTDEFIEAMSNLSNDSVTPRFTSLVRELTETNGIRHLVWSMGLKEWGEDENATNHPIFGDWPTSNFDSYLFLIDPTNHKYMPSSVNHYADFHFCQYNQSQETLSAARARPPSARALSASVTDLTSALTKIRDLEGRMEDCYLELLDVAIQADMETDTLEAEQSSAARECVAAREATLDAVSELEAAMEQHSLDVATRHAALSAPSLLQHPSARSMTDPVASSSKVKLPASLQPATLSCKATPALFAAWRQDFRVYFKSNQYNTCPLETQQNKSAGKGSSGNNSSSQTPCANCGRVHAPDACNATNHTCRFCGVVGHFHTSPSHNVVCPAAKAYSAQAKGTTTAAAHQATTRRQVPAARQVKGYSGYSSSDSDEDARIASISLNPIPSGATVGVQTEDDLLLDDLRSASLAYADYVTTKREVTAGQDPSTPFGRQLVSVWPRVSADGALLLVDGHRIVPPTSHCRQVLELLHEGHPGVSKALANASQTFFWPGLRNEITQFIHNCEACQALRSSSPPAPETPVLAASPMEQLAHRRKHGDRRLLPMPPVNSRVRIQDPDTKRWDDKGAVLSHRGSSALIQFDNGRRALLNKKFLRQMPTIPALDPPPPPPAPSPASPLDAPQRCSARVPKPRERLDL
ncbi:hypothetical protein TCAL_14528 [Tigriopus californicus]|uniref:RNA-directed DNA polymerase n=1 Tax=Tigriopus californicus TaxID=6832 RepID=A0A553PTT6_TIGCA|nr:hypothetical protein TCAL_14528 [Tigriopus californicus]